MKNEAEINAQIEQLKTQKMNLWVRFDRPNQRTDELKKILDEVIEIDLKIIRLKSQIGE
jgi:hypothetical protein